jgi:hypothetical protein
MIMRNFHESSNIYHCNITFIKQEPKHIELQSFDDKLTFRSNQTLRKCV